MVEAKKKQILANNVFSKRMKSVSLRYHYNYILLCVYHYDVHIPQMTF